ncbi:NAD(P)-dependent oxidoreductase [Planktothrix agardhii]|jgi:3-hydroxyisobutyrate dehydrogenase|uniref:Oxidoreductase slr0229 n=1 Tax=Planktothrix agardhii TaxID=1160 RepID=A0AAD1V4G1_PLAAG|nr:NAD(P)-dependent oxidoreductase [Planktothrix agardhii]MCB8766002.1 NAD(P)-dependent oxidoreductase [Planktothrix agardhii 1809]MCB8784052.1 NAD(P)-dependent oxidoreductase [Planktothrix agardhii 1808]MCF3564926.1 NAD(P)-dependent oxidoreductase [Planktothrix agardhii 1807]CAD5918871.1 putative oxidoreductase slr0229 [Planktothrix agardhii]CAD5923161.1 putative oxidoreductase slr0229 [Planktothrix agardhii]
MKTAFLGLGVMGGPMSVNLAASGYSVKAWNRTSDRLGVKIASEAGANIVSSIQEAVTDVDIIFTCVGDIPDVEAVILGEKGIINFAKPGAIVIDFSTIGSEAARRISQHLEPAKIQFLDAPVSGGDIGAKNGTLTIMVGGDQNTFETVKPLLETMGKTIRYCGKVGSGQGVKLCNQVLASLNMVGICEALLLAQKQGIDPNLVVEICSTGAAGSWALSNLGLKVAEGDFEPGFMIKHILKDLRIVQETLNCDPALPGTELADYLFKIVQKLDQGFGENQGTQAMIRAYKEADS